MPRPMAPSSPRQGPGPRQMMRGGVSTLLILLLGVEPSRGIFYLPGVAPKSYQRHDPVSLDPQVVRASVLMRVQPNPLS